MKRKNKNKKKKGRKNKRSTKKKVQVCTDLILLDPKVEKQIRNKAIQKLRRSMKSFDDVTEQQEQFSSVHVPEYESWFNSKFSKEIKLLKSLDEEFYNLRRELIELQHKNMSQAMGFDLDDDDDDDDDVDFSFVDDDDEEFEDGEEECDCFFCRLKRRAAGNDDIEIDEDELEEALAHLFEELFDVPPNFNRKTRRLFEEFKEEARKTGFAGLGSGGQNRSSSDSNGEDKEEHQSSMLSYYYRVLVRKYHPDLMEDKQGFRSDLWNQVQEAYKARDVKTLKHIWAISCSDDRKALNQLPIGEISEAAEGIKSRTKHYRKELRSYKKKPAWNFASLSVKAKSSMSREIKREFAERKEEVEFHIEALSHQIILEKQVDPAELRRRQRDAAMFSMFG